jgi:hypothetical protein
MRNFIICTHPPDIIRQVKSRQMRWAGHVARMGGEKSVQGFGGKMESEWILGRLAWGVWIGFDCLRPRTGGGLL